MNKRIAFASVIALFTLSSSVAFADDCSWTSRGGTMRGACKDSAGNAYCLTCSASGGTCSKTPCPSSGGSGQ